MGTSVSSGDVTHPSLLLRVRNADDAAAWETFVRIYGPLIYSYCRRKNLQENDAADVAQEVLTRVSKAIRTFEYDPNKGRFRDWLGRITHNEIVRLLQAKGKNPQDIGEDNNVELVAGDSGSAWDDHFHAALLDAALKRIESEFEPETWRAFRAVWIETQSPTQAAAELGISVEKTYVAKSRVLKRLQAELLVLCEDIPLFAPKL
ncbi:MAG: RNA polymerase sigma factor [Pirellula sp.]|jgi:RNA polymerase sigma-70 factor (ECF subfamily)